MDHPDSKEDGETQTDLQPPPSWNANKLDPGDDGRPQHKI
jgi:hypothetical protein